MRIAIITESFPPDVNGVAHCVVRVAENLVRKGHHPLIIAPDSGRGPELDAGFPFPVERVPSVPLPGYPSFRLGLPSPATRKAIVRHGTEIVHLASPVALGAWGTRVARAERLPVVAVFQTDLPSYARAYHLGRVAESFTWHWLRDVHNTAGRTLAPSNMTAADLADHGIERVRRWGRGVDTERFQPSRRDEVLRAALAPNGEVIVGYVGRLAIEKRVDLLAAVAALPGVKLAVTGGGPMEEGLRAALPEAAFLGVRSGTDLARIYASLDVFVHTGPFETFGQTIREPPPAACRSSRPPRAAPLTSLTTEGPATWSRPATRTCSRRPCSSWPRTRRCAPGSARRRGGAAAGPRPDLVRAHRRAARTLRGRHRGGRAARPAGGVRQPIVGVWAGMA